MKKVKKTGTESEISNLIGMFAFLVKDKKIKARVYISGKADNNFFIARVISPLTGEPNVAKLMTIEELSEWVIIPNKGLANEIIADYSKDGIFRYGIHF